MNLSSCVIKNSCYFGSYPLQEIVDDLQESERFNCFVDLTHTLDNLQKYTVNPHTIYITYPIVDQSVPENIDSFSTFLDKLCLLIKKNAKMYIHCKGGHYRSGIVIACLISKMYDIDAKCSITLTNLYHDNRPVMKPKWRKLSAIRTYQQKQFIFAFLKPYILYNNFYKACASPLHMNHNCNIVLKDGREFLSIKDAFDTLSKEFYTFDEPCEEFSKYSENLMYNIVNLKLEQHADIKKYLIETHSKPIVFKNFIDNYWGIDKDYVGENKFGKILTYLRSQYVNKSLIDIIVG